MDEAHGNYVVDEDVDNHDIDDDTVQLAITVANTQIKIKMLNKTKNDHETHQ